MTIRPIRSYVMMSYILFEKKNLDRHEAVGVGRVGGGTLDVHITVRLRARTGDPRTLFAVKVQCCGRHEPAFPVRHGAALDLHCGRVLPAGGRAV